jgi:hypothetical protein
MPDSKLRIVAHGSAPIARPPDSATAPVACLEKTDRPSAEENLRLLKAFGRVDDSRRRAWLLELVEHFAGLDTAAH